MICRFTVGLPQPQPAGLIGNQIAELHHHIATSIKCKYTPMRSQVTQCGTVCGNHMLRGRVAHQISYPLSECSAKDGSLVYHVR
jgi:hypothetical protein